MLTPNIFSSLSPEKSWLIVGAMAFDVQKGVEKLSFGSPRGETYKFPPRHIMKN